MRHDSPFCEFGSHDPMQLVSDEDCPVCVVVPRVPAPEPLGHCKHFPGDHEKTDECVDWVRHATTQDAPNLFPSRPVPSRAGREGDSQGLPTINGYPDVQSAVIADIEKRRELGISRYGTALQPFNDRSAMLDLYEELIDAAMYCKQWLIENSQPNPATV